jgi:hypothetical protein
LFANISFGRQPIFVFVPGRQLASLGAKICGLGDIVAVSGRDNAFGKRSFRLRTCIRVL